MTEVSPDKIFLHKNELDASQVLAVALEQMDDIIAAANQENEILFSLKDNSVFPQWESEVFSKNLNFKDKNSETIVSQTNQSSVNNILENLTEYIIFKEKRKSEIPHKCELNLSSAKVVLNWLQKELKENGTRKEIQTQMEENNSFQKVNDLKEEKKNLILQANVLADQVEVQAEKITTLEKVLDQKMDELKCLEQNLHQEVLARSSIESCKLELMTELSNLKLRLTAAERDRKESDEKNRSLVFELASLQSRLFNQEMKQTNLKEKFSKNETASICTNEKLESVDMKSTSEFLSQIIYDELTLSPKTLSLMKNSNSIMFQKSSSVENIGPTIKIVERKFHYDTMPRQTGSQVLQQLQMQLIEDFDHSNSFTENLKSSSIKKDTDSNSKNGRKASSGKIVGVSFAEQENITFPSAEKVGIDHVAPLTPPPYLIKSEKDKKGFLKFFSKWKKSGSQNFDHFEREFNRCGVRATAGPRLGWTQTVSKTPDAPFCQWNVDNIVEWLQRLGLAMYTSESKRWMCNGDKLIKATSSDIEKELCIKNPLHKKKLMLSLKSMKSELPNLPALIDKLDYHWVVRWLDDIGLPQYKDSFAESRVDGKVLHFITTDDLLYLKVNSQLHHLSICRGIQVLRQKGFDPHCLIRRSLPEESKIYTPDLVALWSNHRVMEWLRTVDLSEYAPNLRGSGVHGALIVYEARFNTNLFATILNIPPTKTLLRRHLATHFKLIIGEELTMKQRENETETPLSLSIKVKLGRKNQFTLKKKRTKNEFENEDYVCPMEIPIAYTFPKAFEGDKLVVRRNSDPSPQVQEQIRMAFKTVGQDEKLQKEPTTIV